MAYLIFLFLFLLGAATGIISEMLNAIVGLATILPCLAAGSRRLHDTNRSGWWLLIGFVPAVGGLILLVFMCLDGTPGSNNFGANPKA